MVLLAIGINMAHAHGEGESMPFYTLRTPHRRL